MRISSFNNITLSSLSHMNEKAVEVLSPQAKKIGIIVLAIFVTCLAVYGLYRQIYFKGRRLGQEANKLRKDWKLEEAAKKFQEALKHDPVDTLNLTRYAKTLFALYKDDEALQQLAKAVEQWKKAAENHPKDVKVLREYAKVLMREFEFKTDFETVFNDAIKIEQIVPLKKDLKNIEQVLNEGIKIDSKDVASFLLKAKVTLMLSMCEVMEKCLDGVIAGNDEAEVAIKNVHDQMIEDIKKVIEIAPQDPRPLRDYGRFLEKDKNWDEACKQYEAILKINPKHPYAHHRLGVLSAEKGDFEGAIKHYLTCLETRPSHLLATKDYAIALEHLKKPEEAAKQYEKALEIRPTDFESLWRYGDVLKELEKPAAALEQYEKALKIDPKDSGVMERIEETRALLMDS